MAGYLKQIDFPVGMEGVALTNAVDNDSSIFSIEGSDRVDFYVWLDRGAATSLTFSLYTTWDNTETTAANFHLEQSIEVAAGVGTLSDFTVVKTGIGADVRYRFGFNNVSGRKAWLRCANVGGNGVDLLYVRGIRAVPAT